MRPRIRDKQALGFGIKRKSTRPRDERTADQSGQRTGVVEDKDPLSSRIGDVQLSVGIPGDSDRLREGRGELRRLPLRIGACFEIKNMDQLCVAIGDEESVFAIRTERIRTEHRTNRFLAEDRLPDLLAEWNRGFEVGA